MVDFNPAFLTLLPALGHGARPPNRRSLVARGKVDVLKRAVEFLHPLPVVYPALLSVVDPIVCHNQAFGEKAADSVAIEWLDDALRRSQRLNIGPSDITTTQSLALLAITRSLDKACALNV